MNPSHLIVSFFLFQWQLKTYSKQNKRQIRGGCKKIGSILTSKPKNLHVLSLNHINNNMFLSDGQHSIFNKYKFS